MGLSFARPSAVFVIYSTSRLYPFLCVFFEVWFPWPCLRLRLRFGRMLLMWCWRRWCCVGLWRQLVRNLHRRPRAQRPATPPLSQRRPIVTNPRTSGKSPSSARDSSQRQFAVGHVMLTTSLERGYPQDAEVFWWIWELHGKIVLSSKHRSGSQFEREGTGHGYVY